MNSRLPTLDGWRAIAVGLVIWAHAGQGFFATEADYYGKGSSQLGAFGVDVFFAISGLLITKLLIDERNRFGGISLAGFYIRRVFRILPPVFAYLIAVALTAGFLNATELLSCLLFWRNYLPQDLGSYYTVHLWSLAVEEHFYLTWPALVAFLLYRRVNAMTVAWISVGAGLWRIADAQNHITNTLLPQVPPHIRTDLRMDALLWGCFTAFLIADPAVRRILTGRLRPWMFYLGVVASVACVLLYSQLTSLWIAMLFPFLLVMTILHPEWAVSRLLDHPVPAFLGRMSYSLYMWQQIFLIPAWEPRIWLQHFPQNLVGVFAAAYLSYRLLEKPCMTLGRKLSDRVRQRSLAPASATPAVAPAPELP